jgi:hypothetical protein
MFELKRIDSLRTRLQPGGTPPPIGEAFVVSSRIEMARPSKVQEAAVALSEVLIAEVAAADTLVNASPRFNFGPKTTLRLGSTIYCRRA